MSNEMIKRGSDGLPITIVEYNPDEESKKEKIWQAYQMRLRGYTVSQVAQILNVSRKTVYNYIKAYRDSASQSVESIDQNAYLGEIRSEFAQMREEAWTDFQSANKVSDRIRCLKFISELRLRETKILQDCNAIHQTPQRIEHSVKHEGEVRHAHLHAELSEENLEAVATQILSLRVGMKSEQLLAMRGRDIHYIEPAVQKGQPGFIDQENDESPMPMPHTRPFSLDPEDTFTDKDK